MMTVAHFAVHDFMSAFTSHFYLISLLTVLRFSKVIDLI